MHSPPRASVFPNRIPFHYAQNKILLESQVNLTRFHWLDQVPQNTNLVVNHKYEIKDRAHQHKYQWARSGK